MHSGGDFLATILAVDDEEDMLVLIENILKKNGHCLHAVQNPLELDENSLRKYDLILLDVMMPGMDGMTFCKKIRRIVDCPILFLTAKTMEADVVNGLLSGGDDYITKPFGVQELLARVEAHLRREQREKHAGFNLGSIRFDLSSKSIFVEEEKVPLTKSEYRICVLLAERKGQVFSKEQIYEQVFGYEGEGEPSAVSEHVKNIRAKFQRVGEKPIATVWGIGYKWN